MVSDICGRKRPCCTFFRVRSESYLVALSNRVGFRRRSHPAATCHARIEQGREGLRCIDLPGSTNSEPKVTLNVFMKLRRCFQIHISNISLILTDTGAGGQIVLLSEASLRRILPARRVKKRLIELCSDNNP